jgi:hypothetical protein
MGTLGVVSLLLGMGMAAAAQDSAVSRFNLLDGEKLPAVLAEEPQGDPSRHAAGQEKDKTQPSNKLTTRDQEVVVIAGKLTEEYAVGPYRQAEWTQHRRFSTTRIYVQQPPGGVEFEHWLEIRVPKAGGKANEVRMRDEFEFGLGNRLQLDLYLLTEWTEDRQQQGNGVFEWRGWSAEVRYALADWGEIFGNPTLYFEYIFRNGEDNFIEPKLLFGGELASGWHWGVNFVYERDLGEFKFRTVELKMTAGLSYTILDQKLSIGPAFEWAYEAEHTGPGVRAGRSREFHLGPSIQFRPIPKAHFNIEPLWGLTGESKRLKMFIIFGWDF